MAERLFEQYYPYGLRKVNNEKWLIFNRYMLPIGWESFRPDPLREEAAKLGQIPPSSLIPAPGEAAIGQIDDSRGLIIKNEQEETELLFLYDSLSNPSYHPECWDQYADKLRVLQLSKFASGEEVRELTGVLVQ